MFAATHFDNLLVLFFFAIAILFQILTSAAAKSRKRRDDTQRRSTSPTQVSRPLTTQEDERDEERIRKFLEALGQPTTSKPPPAVAPRPTYQRPIVVEQGDSIPKRRPPVFSPLPPLTTQPPDVFPETEPSAPSTRRERKAFTPRVEVATFEVHEAPPPLEPISEAKGKEVPIEKPQIGKSPDIATLLRSTSGLREAIILREIFGPPRSMQSFDLVGNV